VRHVLAYRHQFFHGLEKSLQLDLGILGPLAGRDRLVADLSRLTLRPAQPRSEAEQVE